MAERGTAERPWRVAIVGSGPSGFYAAEALFKADPIFVVHMYERLPTPFGLVRGGVAPDHPKIKSVTRIYDRIACHECFTFLGNVAVGKDLTVPELRRHYDIIIFACGAETDRRLGIPGEDLAGSHTATEFVGWYNGHPDYCERSFDLSHEAAIIIGQGNVAIDVSRILAKTVDELRNTDIAEHALDTLAESKVREVYLIGRRGPVQAKFTTPEIREIGMLEACDPVVRPEDLEFDSASQIELDETTSTNVPKNIEILREFAGRPPGTKRKRYHIRFLLSPAEIKGDGRVEQVVFERNELVGEPHNLAAKPTGNFETIPCGLIFRSIGYRGLPIPDVPFDERRGVFPNINGRIIEETNPVPGLYVVGWIKRGPSGVIGTNKADSVATVESILADLPNLPPCADPDDKEIAELLAKAAVRPVSYPDWQAIDAAEVARGKNPGKPREKFTRVDEMLDVLKKPRDTNGE